MTDPAEARVPLAVPRLEDLPDPAGKAVLVRVDFNVPLRAGDSGSPVVADDFRIRAALPTLEWLMDHGASVTACTHLGRPKGKVDPAYGVEPVRRALGELIGGVELLENLRFDPGEEAGDPATVDRLVDGYDLFVNDAFGVCHREHASVVGPPGRIPSAAGRLVEREVGMLSRLMVEPARPYVVLLGGAKVSDKLGLIRSLLAKADKVVIAGAMAIAFAVVEAGLREGPGSAEARRWAAMAGLRQVAGLDEAVLEECRELLATHGERIMLPVDGVVLGTGEIPEVKPGYLGDAGRVLDIGPESSKLFAKTIRSAGTLFWNGPLGMFEDERFAAGTLVAAGAAAACRGYTVVGGGDTVAAVDRAGVAKEVDFLSTGGGATLELMEKGDLPGLAALRRGVA